MIRQYRYWIILAMTGVSMFASGAQTLQADRQYEPVELRGDVMRHFYGAPIDSLFLYAYNAPESGWSMIPFQFDEVRTGYDPFKPGNESAIRDSYFIGDDGLLDDNDELVFMVRDLGDQAPAWAWIDNEPSRQFGRLEILLRDARDENRRAYAYLFRCPSHSETVPEPYGFSYDAPSQTIETDRYLARLSLDYGFIQDVAVKAPWGSGVDIFDTHKLRFAGLFDLGAGFPIPIGRGNEAANERDNLYMYRESDSGNYHHAYTAEPVVRLIREVRQVIQFGGFRPDILAFYIKTFFYPFSSEFRGGVYLNPDSLKNDLGIENEVMIDIDMIRQSWDFNEAAAGMRFYNEYNNGILIDGEPDVIDKTVDVPILEWTLASGNQGSMFTWFEVPDTNWQNMEVYYHDNRNGGQADGSQISGGDTGDSVSYGDQGLLLENLLQEDANLHIGFIAYFLPKNLGQADGRQLAGNLGSPPMVSSAFQTFTSSVKDHDRSGSPFRFELGRNYPNPFNSTTRIPVRVHAPGRVTAVIIDLHGREVATLHDGHMTAGRHELVWRGCDGRGGEVPAGMYLISVRQGDMVKRHKMLLVK